MNGLGLLLRRIDPGFQYFEDEQIVVFDEAPVGHLALKVGEAFDDERRLTRLAGSLVRPYFSNLSTVRPDELPICTTLRANLRAGMAITAVSHVSLRARPL